MSNADTSILDAALKTKVKGHGRCTVFNTSEAVPSTLCKTVQV